MKLFKYRPGKNKSYLAHKWGLSHLIPNTHIFKNSSPIPSPMDLESFSVNLTELVAGNTYYYRVKQLGWGGLGGQYGILRIRKWHGYKFGQIVL